MMILKYATYLLVQCVRYWSNIDKLVYINGGHSVLSYSVLLLRNFKVFFYYFRYHRLCWVMGIYSTLMLISVELVPVVIRFQVVVSRPVPHRLTTNQSKRRRRQFLYFRVMIYAIFNTASDSTLAIHKKVIILFLCFSFPCDLYVGI